MLRFVVGLVARVVTSEFSNDWSAEKLVGRTPAAYNALRSAWSVAISPTVAPEDWVTVWTSPLSVWSAVVTAVEGPVC